MRQSMLGKVGKTGHALRKLLAAGLALVPLATGQAYASGVRIALQTDITSLDPHVAPTVTTSAVQEQIYGRLVDMDQDFQLTPGLAVTLRATSATLWEVVLREGVVFSNGAPLTAEDVAFSLHRAANVRHAAGTTAPYVRSIRRVTITGPGKLELETAVPYAQLALDLGRVRIVPASLGEAVRTEDFNHGDAAIGTGPYMVRQWTPGGALELIRNPRHNAYAGPPPEWDNVTFRSIPSDAARLAALLSGDVDVIDKVSLPDVERLRNDPRIRLFSHEGNRTMFLVPDADRETTPYITDKNGQPLPTNPLRDVRVRRAISHAINREALVERTLDGLGVAANQASAVGMFGGANLPPIAYDVARSRALLAEAGYPDGFRMTVHCSNGRYLADRATCQAVAQMLTRAGIRAEAQAEPQNVFYPRMMRSDVSLLLNGWATIGDNLVVLRQAIHTVDAERGYGGFNRGRYSNAEVDSLIERAAATLEEGPRRALQQQAMTIAMSDMGLIPLYTTAWIWASRPGFRVIAGFDEGTRVSQIVSDTSR
ncbi:ABC transporter substrate-binding protein [Roseomonas marmotae]|uniref:ABC transporter substrate-binding protein n=1 Tax=Roseomonas marmotae TaxID=2768161 RepID=A0ABS3KI91_9PROT|nr:ABC transporter substrate-binding protein [Roseomonas marmotae]MBO1077184.1 ABC transporter substrate-binding protein [Roseomonas marmotae]